MELLSPLGQSAVVLVSQIAFIYLRTVNVQAIARNQTTEAIISGWAVGVTGLLSLAIGVNSILEASYIPVLFYLVGGGIGTFIAMRKDWLIGTLNHSTTKTQKQ